MSVYPCPECEKGAEEHGNFGIGCRYSRAEVYRYHAQELTRTISENALNTQKEIGVVKAGRNVIVNQLEEALKTTNTEKDRLTAELAAMTARVKELEVVLQEVEEARKNDACDFSPGSATVLAWSRAREALKGVR